MEIDLTPEQEARLTELARERGTSVGAMVADYALDLLQADDDYIVAVREGLVQADAGDFIEEDEMDVRFAKLMQR